MESPIIQEEFSDYLNLGFLPVETEDGSFSLRQGTGSEPMHSLGGALKESFYIYSEALELFKDLRGDEQDFEVVSVGLGMGYNEIITALKVEGLNYKLLSYESERDLERLFIKRLESIKDYPLYWSPFMGMGVRADELSAAALSLKNNLVNNGPISLEIVESWDVKTRVILFDAYSSKTSESLWSELFLSSLLNKCREGSVFATYAATGVLKRALKNNNFKNKNKSGFGSKRQSTLAYKE